MPKILRSRDNPRVRQLVALAHSARDRKKAGLTVLDGIHLITAYTDSLGPPQLIAIAESAWTREEVHTLLPICAGSEVVVLADPLMAEISSLESPAFMVATIRTPPVSPLPADATMLVLEDVQDPGNVGSLLRSAAAAGLREVVTSRSTAFAWSPKVLRAAQGAHFALNISEGRDLLELLAGYRGTSLALVVSGERPIPLYDCDLTAPVAFVIGNEGAGLSAALMRAADVHVTIPMPGRTESLNAAAAGAICIFEMVRQRNFTKHLRG
jgi:TrmH family RNA methyltransferase